MSAGERFAAAAAAVELGVALDVDGVTHTFRSAHVEWETDCMTRKRVERGRFSDRICISCREQPGRERHRREVER